MGIEDAYYIDTEQRKILDQLKIRLDKGELTEVRDTPAYWGKFTMIELAYILSYFRKKGE